MFKPIGKQLPSQVRAAAAIRKNRSSSRRHQGSGLLALWMAELRAEVPIRRERSR